MKISETIDLFLITDSSKMMEWVVKECRDYPGIELRVADDLTKAISQIAENIPSIILIGVEESTVLMEQFVARKAFQKEWRDLPLLVVTDNKKRVVSKLVEKNASTISIDEDATIFHAYLSQYLPIKNGNNPDEALNSKAKIIKNKIKEVQVLMPMPSIISDIMSVMSDPTSSAANISEIIMKDQALTAKVLKIVNSAYYGFHRKIVSIQHAIVILGFQEIRNIAIAACMVNAYPVKNQSEINSSGFWMHSLGTAYIAQYLSRSLSEISEEEAFVTGLLHDIGKVVLLQHFGDFYNKAIKKAKEEEKPLDIISRSLIGIDHSEVGRMVAEIWNLPQSLEYAIGFHHCPDKAPEDTIHTHIAHVANGLCHLYGYGNSGNESPDPMKNASLKRVGISEEELETLGEPIRLILEKLNALPVIG